MKNRIKFDPADYPKTNRKNSRIEIKTPCVNGEPDRVEYSWKLGPKNLIKAAKTVSGMQGYSNEYGASWIEIAGVRLSCWDGYSVTSISREEKNLLGVTSTRRASGLINDIFTGRLAADRKWEKEEEAE